MAVSPFARVNQDCVDIIVEYAACSVKSVLGLRSVTRAFHAGVRNFSDSLLRRPPVAANPDGENDAASAVGAETIDDDALRRARDYFARDPFEASALSTVLMLAATASDARCTGVDLPRCNHACTDGALARLAQLLGPRAQFIRVSAAPTRRALPISDAGVHAVATHCPNLRGLHITQRTKRTITDASVAAIAEKCAHLEELAVPRTEGIDDWDDDDDDDDDWDAPLKGITNESLLALAASHCHARLRVLDVSGAEMVEDESIVAVAAACPRLSVLRVAQTDITNQGVVECLRRCPNLTSIDVSKNRGRISDSSATAIAEHCPNLIALGIGANPDLDSDSTVTDVGLAAIAAGCPKLRELDVSNSRRASSVTDEGVAAIARGCPDLRKLDVSDTFIGNAAMRHVADHCPKLTHLSFGGKSNISDEGIMFIVDKCKAIAFVHLGNKVSWKCESDQLSAAWRHVEMVRDL